MSSTPEFNEEQLSAARAKSWHQSGEPLLTAEDAIEWIERFGLVPFSPTKLSMVAPSLVEATLGAKNDEPSATEAQAAREMVGRMAGEGAALPLNLFGGPGDTPDFLVSGPMFRYIFTLRGDKSWKQAPQTAGALKVSPLSLKVYEALVAKGASTAAELANELGREVTEAAIGRALTELWTLLRVIPLIAPGDKPSLWELTSRRFTKGIKAGVNAGQPTALSALISVYLTQMHAATEEEIETFLSPLAARSRVREVLHALVGARELETTVVAGKTLMHVPGDLPAFDALPVAEVEESAIETEAPAEEGSFERKPRISTFAGGEKKPYVARSRPAGARPSRPAGLGEGKPKKFGTGPRKTTVGAAERPSFTKPWDEDKKPRTASGDGAFKSSPFSKFAKDAPKRSFHKKEEGGDEAPRTFAPRSYEKKPFGAKPFGAKRAYTPTSGGAGRTFDGPKRPYTPREPREGGGSFDGPKRPYTPREPREGGSSFAKPAFRKFDAPKRPYTPREGGSDAPRTPYAAKRTFSGASASGGFDGAPKRPYVKREGGSFDGPKRPYAPRAPREGGFSKPGFAGSSDGPKRPYVKREGGSFGASSGERGNFAPRKSFGDSPRPFRPRPDGGDRPSFSGRPSFSSRPKFGAKPAKPKFGQGKMFDKKGPLPADGEGGLSPTGSKRKQRKTEE